MNTRINQYIENVRQNIIDIYKMNEEIYGYKGEKIRHLALDTLMHLDRCLAKYMKDENERRMR